MRKTIAAIAVLAALALGLPMSGAASAPSPDDRGGVPTSESPKPIRRVPPGDRAPARPNDVTTVSPQAAAAGYSFVPINPFRALDSRTYSDGYLLAGDTWSFDVLTNENGVQQIPSDAVAVTYNLTVTATNASGYLAIYPAGINWPGSSSINWTASGTTLANGGTVAIGFLNGPGEVEVYVGPAGGPAGTDFLIDITGYYI